MEIKECRNDNYFEETADVFAKNEGYINVELYSLMNKYGILLFNGKRYYKFDMATALPILENSVPYLFRYENIEIYESSWNKMAVRILVELDKDHPISTDDLLKLNYWWSNAKIFSSHPRTNFTPFKGVFLNTNHTSTHSMMSIQCLLKAYAVSPSNCFFVVRKHPIAEPEDVRKYFRNSTIVGFRNCMSFRGFSKKSIETAINNFKTINQLLKTVSQGYDDFFLFDDYGYFSNYKVKTLQKACSKFISNEKFISAIEKTLSRLDAYYKNKFFYDSITKIEICSFLRDELHNEIEYLFDSLNASVITSSKLYARMLLMHPDSLKSLNGHNSSKDVFLIVNAFFEEEYLCKQPFISKDREMKLGNDDIIISFAYNQNEVTVKKLNNYADKMHLKRISNYLELMINIADDFVQTQQDKLVKKELLEINNEQLAKIQGELEFYIKNFGKIRSETYSSYPNLPELRYKWNKYLLLGIARTYLSNKFKIEYSSGTYKTFDFSLDFQ